jgi:hypothetical protein
LSRPEQETKAANPYPNNPSAPPSAADGFNAKPEDETPF